MRSKPRTKLKTSVLLVSIVIILGWLMIHAYHNFYLVGPCEREVAYEAPHPGAHDVTAVSYIEYCPLSSSAYVVVLIDTDGREDTLFVQGVDSSNGPLSIVWEDSKILVVEGINSKKVFTQVKIFRNIYIKYVEASLSIGRQ